MTIATVAQKNALATAYGVSAPYLGLGQALIQQANTSVAGTTVSVDLTVGVGDTVVFNKGGASEETRVVSAVSGTGPYTITVPALTYAHTAGQLISHLPISSTNLHEIASTTRAAALWGSASVGAITSAVAAAITMPSGANVGAILMFSAVSAGTYLDAAAVPGQNFASAGGTYLPTAVFTEV